MISIRPFTPWFFASASAHSASGTPRFQQQAMASSVLYTVNSAGMPTWTWHHSVSASASKSTLPGSSATFFAIRSAWPFTE